MYRFIITSIIIIVLVIIARILIQNKKRVQFIITGLDSGFKINEIILLLRVAESTMLDDPVVLFWSVPALSKSIAQIIHNCTENKTINSTKVQNFLAKLYKYRTKVELDPKNNKTLKTTRGLMVEQRLRVLLKGKGVFSSRVLNAAGKELIITLPVQKDVLFMNGEEWIGKQISVYLQRPGDAGYVFDTDVYNSIQYNSHRALCLAHSDKLLRSQKRKSVRSSCSISAQLYVINSETMGRVSKETNPGLKCLLEDISEDGAMIRIGGRGVKNIQMKLQFIISNQIVVMFGVIRAVEYNSQLNQSRLHFECIEIEPMSKNIILSFVYNVLPQEQKDVFDAIKLAEQDSESEDEYSEDDEQREEETTMNSTDIDNNKNNNDVD